MEKNEFVMSADKLTQIDKMCCGEVVRKTTIFDITNYVAVVEDLMDRMDLFRTAHQHAISDRIARDFVQAIGENVILGRRAWVHGHDTAYEVHPMQLFHAGSGALEDEIPTYGEHGNDLISMTMRDVMREFIEREEHQSLRHRFFGCLGELAKDILDHMNPNQYVVHDIHVSNSTTRTVVTLQEFDDWRAMQWTAEQIEKIRLANNDN
jgi:hypothetical protein